MQTYTEIKRFVQETPGCSCPEEVFKQIDYQKECDGLSGSKVTVGDRLLIYIITMDGKSNIQGVINSASNSMVELILESAIYSPGTATNNERKQA